MKCSSPVHPALLSVAGSPIIDCRTAHLRSFLSSLLLATIAALLGLSAQDSTLASTPPPQEIPVDTAATPCERTAWDIYTTPIVVPASEIVQITLDYEQSGWTYNRFNIDIVQTPDGYQTSSGEPIDANLVAALGDSLIHLRPSGSVKSCDEITDFYPSWDISIRYSDNREVTLISDSNCFQGIPWNVVYQGNLYVQYTGDISMAFIPLLGALPDNPFQVQPFDPVAEMELREEVFAQTELTFLITPGVLPAAARETNFSEQELYTQLLTESPLFEPFASAYEVLNLDLICSLSSENLDCAALQGFLTLRSRENDTQMSLLVQFEGAEVTEIEVDGPGV